MAADATRAPKRIGHFRILSEIGRGGMGVVYRAVDEDLNRPVAIKLLLPKLSGDEARRQRFLREAKSAARVVHENVAVIHELGGHDGQLYIAMELVEGRSLREHLGGGPLELDEALRLARDIAAALACAHGTGVIHRDLKPENVMVTPAGRAKLLDFGIAKAVASSAPGTLPAADDPESEATATAALTGPGVAVGTPGYMPPEQVQGLQTDARADVFAFGAVLHEMLGGEAPFRGRSAPERVAAVLRDAPAPLSRPTPPAIASLIETCLDKDPSRRFHDGESLSRALAGALEGQVGTPAAPPRSVPNNLPHETSSFVGRDGLLAEVRVVTDVPLVTLAGPGGSGKTRLSLRAAKDLLGDFPDGVWWVELSPLRQPDQIAQAVCTVLGVRDRVDMDERSSLFAHLARQRTLLVLDNCEHLVEAVAELVHDIVRRCPHVRILASSRELLGITPEVVVRVPPLGLPAVGPQDGDPAALDCEAARLFVERAGAARPGLVIAAEDVQRVVEICRGADALPLAIELAAARLRVLSLEQLHSRLGDRLGILAGGRSVDPRHRAVRAAIDWSYELLAEDARLLYSRLSVFAGSFSLEAAEEVCAMAPLDPEAVLDLLASLVDRSMVATEEGAHGAVRYRMLETLREYAAERCRERGEGDALRRGHASYYRNASEARRTDLLGANDPRIIAQVRADYDNATTAMEWSLTDGDPRVGVGIAAGLTVHWFAVGQFAEAQRWLTPLLRRVTHDPTPQIAQALAYHGSFTDNAGDATAADQWGDEGVRLARQAGEPVTLAIACFVRANVIYGRLTEVDRGAALQEEALEILKQRQHPAALLMIPFLANIRWIQNRPKEAVALCDELAAVGIASGQPLPTQLANFMRGAIDNWLGDYAHARACTDQAQPFFEAAGVPLFAAGCLHSRAVLAHVDGDLEAAAAYYDEMLVIYRANGQRNIIAAGLASAGWLALDRGQRALALERFAEAAQLALQRQAWGLLIFSCEGLAALRMDLGDAEQAVRLFALGAWLHERYCSVYWAKRDELDVAARVERLRAELAPRRFAELWAEGRAMHPASLLDPA